MRLNPKYILREVAGETLLISIQDLSAPKRLLCLNPLGTDIYTLLRDGFSRNEIVERLLEEYDVERTVLEADTDDFIATLRSYEVLID